MCEKTSFCVCVSPHLDSFYTYITECSIAAKIYYCAPNTYHLLILELRWLPSVSGVKVFRLYF